MFCGKRAGRIRASRGKKVRTKRAAAEARLEAHAVAAMMTWQDAERMACDWMRLNGYSDATLTPAGADGGIDVISRKGVAQVKHHAKPVGIAEVQRLYGIAQTTGRTALFFSTQGFTAKAATFARQYGVQMYRLAPIRRET